MRLSGLGPPQVQATARVAKETSALRLAVRTADGDTVEISIEARSLRQRERASARGAEGRISQRSESRSNSLTASVKVNGELSDAEVEDIRELLESLSAGGVPQAGEGELDTISAYRYSYQHSREVGKSQVMMFA